MVFGAVVRGPLGLGLIALGHAVFDKRTDEIKRIGVDEAASLVRKRDQASDRDVEQVVVAGQLIP